MFLSLWSTSSYSMTHSRQSLVHGQQPQVLPPLPGRSRVMTPALPTRLALGDQHSRVASFMHTDAGWFTHSGVTEAKTHPATGGILVISSQFLV